MNGNGTWQLQHAKARLSEVVRCAHDEGPQVITVHGNEAAVLVSAAEYQRLAGPKQSLIDVLLSSPLREMGLSNVQIDELFARDPSDIGRDVSFDD